MDTEQTHPRTKSKKIRVAHLASHPIQYYAPLYRALSGRPEIELTVYFFSEFSTKQFTDEGFGKNITWDVDLLSGYTYRMCRSAIGNVQKDLERRVNLDLVLEVFRERYDAIWILSYASMNAVIVRGIAFALGIPVLFRDDTNLLTPRPVWKNLVKHLFLRLLLHGAWGLYVGTENKRYWTHYGIPEARQFFSPHAVDDVFFRQQAIDLLPSRQEIRRQFGITDDAPVILFCGKFIDIKQPMMLLSAYAKVRKCTPCWLLLVGDGPLRESIEMYIDGTNITQVILPGFLNQTALPQAYIASDLLVLPSRSETWGLVVNEAMNFSLPIIVSDRVGCAADLVKEGENGFVFPYQDENALSASISALVDNPDMRNRFGIKSRMLITRFSIESSTNGIIRAVGAACNKSA